MLSDVFSRLFLVEGHSVDFGLVHVAVPDDAGFVINGCQGFVLEAVLLYYFEEAFITSFGHRVQLVVIPVLLENLLNVYLVIAATHTF